MKRAAESIIRSIAAFPPDTKTLYQALSIFGRLKEINPVEIEKTAAELKLRIDALPAELQIAAPEAQELLKNLLSSAAVIGGCGQLLLQLFAAAAALRPSGKPPIRQSLQFRLAGLQAEHEAISALLVETISSLLALGPLQESTVNSARVLRAVLEHLQRIYELEPILVLGDAGFDQPFLSSFCGRQRALLAAAAVLFPGGLGLGATCRPIADSLGLRAA